MPSLGLFFAGSVLFINGLTLLGCCKPSGAAPVNAMVGTLLLAVVAFIALPVRDLSLSANRELVVGSVGFLLFAFTYLWVAINSWTSASDTGLGWYCLWAAGVSVFLAVVNFTRYHDLKFGALWLLWSVLYTLFFVVLALEVERLRWATGWVTITESFITTTIPGALLLLGEWHSISGGVAIGTALTAILVFTLLAARSTRRWPASASAAESPLAARTASYRRRHLRTPERS